LEIMEGLRGHMSGLAIPTYCVDAPHGGGKIPLLPNYLVSASDDCVVLRNYEGMLVRYQAEDKKATTKPTANCGVSQLIQGTKTALIPPGSERMERRRQRLHEPVKAASCCDTHDEPAQLPPPKSRKRLASLAVVS
jgi:lysine 2,3-aminomutase